jgi:hypothetical protein
MADPIHRHTCPVVASTPADQPCFVGFHDICPWSPDNRVLAVHRMPADLAASAEAEGALDICLWDPVAGSLEPVGRTTTWSWEQGARLQWLPGAGATLAYNLLLDGAPGSVLHDLDSGRRRELPFTVYALSPTGRHALSPHFGRLRAYWSSDGYAGAAAPGQDQALPDNDGIHRLDLETGARELLVSVAQAAALGGEYARPDTPHFLTHPTYNPDGGRFVFMHRYITADRALYSRLIAADADGGSLRVLAQEKCSHFAWLDNDTLVAWARFAPRLAAATRRRGLLGLSLLRPLVRKLRSLSPRVKQRLLSEYYYVLPVDDPGARAPLAPSLLEQDGHPMFSADRRWMLTDTYPGPDAMQTLILFDIPKPWPGPA